MAKQIYFDSNMLSVEKFILLHFKRGPWGAHLLGTSSNRLFLTHFIDDLIHHLFISKRLKGKNNNIMLESKVHKKMMMCPSLSQFNISNCRVIQGQVILVYIIIFTFPVPVHKVPMLFMLHELYRLTGHHMTLCDVKIHHGSLESGLTLLTL